MPNKIFAFTIRTKTNIESGNVFSANGDLVGRILRKHPKFKDEWNEMKYDGFYTYDIETSKSNFEKIKNNKITLDLDDYSVDDCNTSWIREE